MRFFRRYHITGAAGSILTASITSPCVGYLSRITLSLATSRVTVGNSGISFAWVGPQTCLDAAELIANGQAKYTTWLELLEIGIIGAALSQGTSGLITTLETWIVQDVGSQSFLQAYGASDSPSTTAVLEWCQSKKDLR